MSTDKKLRESTVMMVFTWGNFIIWRVVKCSLILKRTMEGARGAGIVWKRRLADQGKKLQGKGALMKEVQGDDGGQERLLALGQGWDSQRTNSQGGWREKKSMERQLTFVMETDGYTPVGEHMPEWAGDRTGQHLPLELQLFATRRI